MTTLHLQTFPRRSTTLGALAIAALLAAGCAATPPAPPVPLSQQVESAQSPADHRALAQRYEQEAEEARKRARDHRALLASYQRGPQYRWIDRVGPAGSTATGMPAMPRHCETLARNDEEAARTYSEMAAQHRRWAQQPSDGGHE